MSSRFEKVRMTPDATVHWLRGTYDWGEILFAEEAVRRMLKKLCREGSRNIDGARMISNTEQDGIVWEVGGIALKHYLNDYTDPVNATKANVTLGVGLERIEAHTGSTPLRAPTYFALALPNRDWLGRGDRDGLAMTFVPGRHPTREEYEAELEVRDALCRTAIAACGGDPTYYILDERPPNLIVGDDGITYRLDIDMH